MNLEEINVYERNTKKYIEQKEISGKRNFISNTQNKKCIYICIFIIIQIFNNVKVQASDLTTDMIQQQQQNFGINDFVKEAEKYTGSFFEDMNLSEMINSAILGEIDNNTILKKILNLLGTEVKSSLKTLIGILAIVLIHSILKAISENLEDTNISKIIYYVQYILIVTLIMGSFSDIINSVRDTIENLVGFMNCLVPLLITLMLYTGSIVTSGLIQPIILFMIEFIGNIIISLILPVVSIIAALAIISKISDKVQIGKITSFMKSSIVWFLGIILTIFVGVISLEGSLTSSVDGITAKTAKAAVSSLIPVVGKILGDSVDTVLGCGLVLKNALGVVGVIIILGISILPIIKLATLTIMYNIASSVIEPIADEKMVKLLDEMGGVFKLLLAILCSASVLLIIGVTLVVKISNSGMMYR